MKKPNGGSKINNNLKMDILNYKIKIKIISLSFTHERLLEMR
jgi:hypothetical protein